MALKIWLSLFLGKFLGIMAMGALAHRLVAPPAGKSFMPAPYISSVVLYRNYTGVRDNDFTARFVAPLPLGVGYRHLVRGPAETCLLCAIPP